MAKSTYTFSISNGINIIIDRNNQDWDERWHQYFELKELLEPPKGIYENSLNMDVIPKFIEKYDKILFRVSDKSTINGRRKELLKLYTSLEKSLESRISKMNLKGNLNPLLDKIFLEDIEDLKTVFQKKIDKKSKDPFNLFIFEIYHVCLAIFKKKNSKQWHKSRLEKFLEGQSSVSYTELANRKSRVLLEALDKVKNPQMTTDHKEAKTFVAEYLINFEKCYDQYIKEKRFNLSLKTAEKKVQRIVFNAYKEDSKDNFLNSLGVGYNPATKKYYYK